MEEDTPGSTLEATNRLRPQRHQNEDNSGLPWLTNHRVALPDIVEGYVERPELEQRCAATDRRLVVLHAPGGFGKTALLTRCCHGLRRQGIAVAWLVLDEQDRPIDFIRYIEFAFEQAGLDAFERVDHPREPSAFDGETDTPAENRIGLLLRAIHGHHGKRFLLVLDEVERLRDSESIAVLNALLRGAPGNLSIVLAYRERPQGLDTATQLLEGRGEVISATDLRFSTPDIVRLFQSRLSSKTLARVTKISAGWPIALRLYRNAQESGRHTLEPGGDDDTLAAWIETRLWRGLSSDDRDFILDVALFDWIDPVLIDEVTGSRNSSRRIDSISSLAGLLQTTEGDDSVMRLHPLIREYCATRRYLEDAPRFGAIHAAIAEAMAGRGHILEAMRHGAEAGDPHLAGKIAEQEGSVTLWFREGIDALKAVDGCLTPESVANNPRLALVRCVVLAISGNMDDARRIYESMAAKTSGFTQNLDGDVDRTLQVEHMLVLGMMLVWGCSYVSHFESLISTASHFEDEAELDPLTRGVVRLGFCLSSNEMSEFEQAAIWLERARADVGRYAPYLSAHIDLQRGLTAMAQGRCQEAADAYRRALKSARPGHPGDSSTIMIGETLSAELAFERSTGTPRGRSATLSPKLLAECGAWLDVYAASVSVTAELALLDSGVDAALAVVENAVEFARATGRSALARLMSAMRVSFLVTAERVDEAQRIWRSEKLPVEPEACLDLAKQRWREIETIACARLLLLNARRESERARQLAAGLSDLAEKRNLVRTLMRSLVLAMKVEHDAGSIPRATGHLVSFLRLFADTDYARPLAREREIALALLEPVMESHREDPVAVTAARLRNALTEPTRYEYVLGDSDLTLQELEVLQLLGTNSDKEIAKQLNLTHYSLRYRIRRIFAKLGAKGRHDAVHRAREFGLLYPDFHRAHPTP